ncbi:adhesion G-protein coupled receptor F3-like isoform X2 [Dendropsophus ebraccatus]|uniref:adhesion G-protein coupled receptor F3-like isoform X2 n=1 Tax=Dendropsophus ebraccatus TaxID=150705 RepID=UPI0038312F93
MHTATLNAENENEEVIKKLVKAVVFCTPQFGLTWTVGLPLMSDGSSVVFQYLFVILNPLQVFFLFISGCLLDKKVMDVIKKRMSQSRVFSSTVEITGKTPERRLRKSSGGLTGMAYIQVIPLNEDAADLNNVKNLLTNGNFPFKDPSTEITSIAATTECTKREWSMQCQCEPGFQFNMEQCKSHTSCYIPMEIESYCFCPSLNASNTVYCEEPPPRASWGLYVCRFDYRSLHWQASHMVEFPLRSSDIASNPPNIFLWKNLTVFSGITVECCIPDDGRSYYVYWEPGHVIADLVYRGRSLCYQLSISNVPGEDMDYRCIFRDDLDTVVESRVHVGVITDTERVCADNRDDRWRVTKAGYTAEILCASGKSGQITRSCLMTGQWATPQTSCVDIKLQALLEQSQRLNGGLGSPESDIPQMIQGLRNYTSPSLNYITDPADIITVVETIKVLSMTAVESNIQLYAATMSDLVTVWSRLLNFHMETFWTPALIRQPILGSMFLQSVENISRLFEPDSNSFMFIRPNAQMSTVVLSPLVWTKYYKSFNGNSSISVVIKYVNMRNGDNVTAINMLLKNLTKILPRRIGESVKGHGHIVGNYILVNTIKIRNQSRSQANLDMIFAHRKNPNRTAMAQCVFWDNGLFDGAGGWSAEGCRTIHVNDSVVCRYRRVAAFSVLMSLGVSEDDILETVRQVGVSLSILSLLISLIIYIIEWKWVVKDDITFYRQVALINISLSMLIADLWFLGSTFIRDSSHANKLCISAAFFQHYFYLATMFWMKIQGLILLYELLFSSYQLIRLAVISVMVGIGYICPFIVASVTIGIDYPKEGYITEGGCFLNQEDGAVFAFSGPVLLIVVLNCFPIGAIIWNSFQPPNTIELEEEEDDRKAWVAKGLTILTSVFGIIWFLETAALIDEVHEDVHTALEIINTFQGVIIFIIVCLLDKRIREALWKMILKFLALFSCLNCCECNSYNVEQTSEPEAPETYRQIDIS